MIEMQVAAEMYREMEEIIHGDTIKRIRTLTEQHNAGMLLHSEYIEALQEVIARG